MNTLTPHDLHLLVPGLISLGQCFVLVLNYISPLINVYLLVLHIFIRCISDRETCEGIDLLLLLHICIFVWL